MKKFIILTAFLVPTLLVGCSDPAQAKKERCTQLQNQEADAFMGKGTRKRSEIKAEWDKLQCHQTDIIHG